MKVLFIFPNYDCPLGISIGVSYLSAALKEHGHETRILHICDEIDYGFDISRIKVDVNEYNPEIIAFSVGENHYEDMCNLAKQLKEENENTPIVFGGIHITLNAEDVMKLNPFIDFCIVGEGDDALPDLVDKLSNDDDLYSIPNVWARDKNRNIIKNKMRPLKDITNLPFMDLDEWKFEEITKTRRGWVNISMNRGCPYRCSFCHNVGQVKILKENFNTKGTSNSELGYLRVRGIDDIISELCSIKQKYPLVTAFSFIDDTFTFDRNHMKKFFVEYKEKVNLPFICLTTVNSLDEEIISFMADAGCDMIRFGVESASPRIRKELIKRNFSNKKILEIFSLCKKYSIRTFAYNIIAHPTEKKEEILATLKLNATILPEGVRVSLGYPYKGTPYYNIAKSLDQIEDESTYHNYSTYTKFKFTEDEKLWIDKCNSYFKWWLNAFADNESSVYYKKLIDELEALSKEQWENHMQKILLQNKDQQLTDMLKENMVTHYTSPFSDRPDIVILFDAGKEKIKREELDGH